MFYSGQIHEIVAGDGVEVLVLNVEHVEIITTVQVCVYIYTYVCVCVRGGVWVCVCVCVCMCVCVVKWCF